MHNARHNIFTLTIGTKADHSKNSNSINALTDTKISFLATSPASLHAKLPVDINTHVTDSTENGREITEINCEINFIREITKKSEINLEIRNQLRNQKSLEIALRNQKSYRWYEISYAILVSVGPLGFVSYLDGL